MKRFPDWPERLQRAINERRALPHAWGSNDCALFAADLVAAITGQDFGVMFRGRYSDEAGARAMMAAHGWADLAALADHCLPRREERPRRGDVALQGGRFGPFLGIIWQRGVIGPGPNHAIIWPPKGIIGLWGVG